MADETMLTEDTSPEQESVNPSGDSLLTSEDEPTETPGETEKSEDQAKDDKTQGAPEAYEDFTLPEGLVPDEELIGEFVPVAKELNLTQEQAQRLVDLQAQAKLREIQQWQNTRKEWRQQAQADPEIGGPALKENLSNAKLPLKEFGSTELSELFEVTGLGDNPHFIKFLSKIGSQMKESGYFSAASQGVPSERDLAKILFPNQM